MVLKRVALALLAAGSPLLLGSFFVGGWFSQLAFVLISVLFPVAFLALGIGRGSSRARWIWSLLGLALLFEISVGLIIWQAGQPPSEAWLLGLPPATLLMLCGLGLAPLILIGLAYAAAFDQLGSSDERFAGKQRGS